MPLSTHLLLIAGLTQAFIAAAFILSQVHLEDALDRPVPADGDRTAHVNAVRDALMRTVPLTLVAVVVAGILAQPALSAFVPDMTGNPVDVGDVVRGMFGALWVFGTCVAAALIVITAGLWSRLSQLRSARR